MKLVSHLINLFFPPTGTIILWLIIFSYNFSGMAAPYMDTDKALFARIATGDESAFRVIFHNYNRILYPYALSVLKIEADAQEIIQEVFLKLWLKREKLTAIENPGGWLYTVADNAIKDHFKKEARYARRLQNAAISGGTGSTVTHDSDLSDIHAAFDRKEIQLLITEAVDQLPTRRRQVFQMNRLEGYSRKEIADILGISENGVRNRLAEATEFVQDYIRKHKSLYLPALLVMLLAENLK
jgi:RNA polymerase sigma-70 factor (family 1)